MSRLDDRLSATTLTEDVLVDRVVKTVVFRGTTVIYAVIDGELHKLIADGHLVFVRGDVAPERIFALPLRSDVMPVDGGQLSATVSPTQSNVPLRLLFPAPMNESYEILSFSAGVLDEPMEERAINGGVCLCFEIKKPRLHKVSEEISLEVRHKQGSALARLEAGVMGILA